MAIQTSSAVLKAYFETGDVPTAAQFGDFFDSTAVYDGTLENIVFSGSSTGSFGQIRAKELHPYTGSININVSGNLIPSYASVTVGSNLGSEMAPFKTLYAVSASIDHLSKHTGSAAINVSGGLNPSVASIFDLGTTTSKWKTLHVSGVNVDYVSSSLIPDQDDTRDLGSSGREWKDLYIDGTAYIDTLSTSTTFATITVTTASLTIVSSSRIDGVGGYGNIIISGGLVPGTTNVFDLGTTSAKWGELFLGTGSIDVISSSRIDGVQYGDITISGSLIPGTTNKFDLGDNQNKWLNLYVSGAAIDAVSSSLIPDQDNLRDLGSSTREWKDLYVDGTAYIDTISIDTIPTVTIVTASISVISSSRIDGVGGYGNVIISGGLVPGTTNVFDLGTTTTTWRALHVSGVNVGYVSSSLIPDQDNLRDLGSSAREWKDLYIDGTANIDTLSADTGSIGRVGSNLSPTANNTYIIGSSSYYFKEASAYSASINHIAKLTGSSAITISGGLAPSVTDAFDLGTSALQFRSASIRHITASTLVVGTITANTTNYTATNTITGSNQFGSGSTNTNSFSGSISAVTDITASGNISASGTITAATFNFANASIDTTDISSSGHIWVSGGSAANLVFLSKDGGHITASGNISSSKEFIGASAYITNITASNNISSSGTISSTGIIYSAGMITSSVGFSTIGGHVSASDASGSVQIISGGIYIKRNEGASADDSDYTVHGRRFTVRNKLQEALPASASSSPFIIDNASVNDGDVIIGTFMGLTGAGVGTLGLSASIHCFTTASIGGGFKFYIHNNKTTAIADDSDFTASFVVL